MAKAVVLTGCHRLCLTPQNDGPLQANSGAFLRDAIVKDAILLGAAGLNRRRPVIMSAGVVTCRNRKKGRKQIYTLLLLCS